MKGSWSGFTKRQHNLFIDALINTMKMKHWIRKWTKKYMSDKTAIEWRCNTFFFCRSRVVIKINRKYQNDYISIFKIRIDCASNMFVA